jgi:PAS domain-containing protein
MDIDFMKMTYSNKTVFQIVVPFAVITAAFLAVVMFFIIPSIKSHFLEQRKEYVKDMVLNTYRILSVYEELVRKKLITREAAQELARKQIRSLRYGTNKKNYFWVISSDGTVLVNPSAPEYEGINKSNLKDSSGKTFIKSFIDTAVSNKDGGFVQYNWYYYLNKKHISSKISYVKLFPPWNWVLGSGIYIEDMQDKITFLTTMVLVITFLLILIFSYMASILVKKFILSEHSWHNVADKAMRTESKIRMMIQAIPDMLLRINKDGVILDVKEPLIFECFIPPEKLLGSNIKEIFPEFAAEINLNAVNETFRTSEHQTVAFEISFDEHDPKKHRIKHFEAHFIKCGPDEVLGTYRDISERFKVRFGDR